MKTVRIIIYALTAGLVIVFLFLYSNRLSRSAATLDTLTNADSARVESERNIKEAYENKYEELDSLSDDMLDSAYQETLRAIERIK